MRGIRKRYPGVVALDDVSFDLRAGEVHVLLGENGAGKSTLVKILGGVVGADGGSIEIDGQEVSIAGPRMARRHGVGFIHQELNLVPRLSAAENVFLGGPATRWGAFVDWPELHRQAEAALRPLGARFAVRTPAASLSLSDQQLVEIARALQAGTRILIMDEPTSSLSAAEVDRLFDVVARLTAQGLGIVYISHRMEEVFRVGHRVTVLRDGRTVGTRAIRDTTAAELIRMMAGRELAQQYPRRVCRRGEELLRVERLARGDALHDVSLSLHRGEIVGLAGLVGAGRTELARAIVGADPVDRGHIVVRGRRATIRTPADAVRHGIGFLPEDRKRDGLVLGLSLERNVGLATLPALARAGLVSRRLERGQAEEAISTLGIRTTGPEQRALTLSGGNQQKVVLARWLATRADIFIFDEPTRGVDVAARHDIYALMNRLVEQGAGILMISSDLPELIGMSDRIVVLAGGEVRAEFAASDATDTAVLRAALGGAA
jgi:ribose transport system ATP-binding protein